MLVGDALKNALVFGAETTLLNHRAADDDLFGVVLPPPPPDPCAGDGVCGVFSRDLPGVRGESALDC